MDASKLTIETFLKDIEKHTLKIIKDDGLYRHIICSDNGSPYYKFEIVTFPEYLVYVGDMGSFVFERTNDMFCFFRRKELEINSYYWAEKVVAETIHGGIRKFSVEEFRNNVIEYTKQYLDLEENIEIPKGIMKEIKPLLHAEDEWECVTSMRDFHSNLIQFNDFWESSCNKETYHYIWCCYAIVWAIQQYDRQKGIQ
jgi:hypothetical protein